MRILSAMTEVNNSVDYSRIFYLHAFNGEFHFASNLSATSEFDFIEKHLYHNCVHYNKANFARAYKFLTNAIKSVNDLLHLANVGEANNINLYHNDILFGIALDRSIVGFYVGFETLFTPLGTAKTYKSELKSLTTALNSILGSGIVDISLKSTDRNYSVIDSHKNERLDYFYSAKINISEL